MSPICFDKVTMAHRICKDQLRKNIPHRKDSKKFGDTNSTLSEDLIRNVRQKLDLTTDLSLKDIRFMYLTCTYELAIDGHSPWCVFFNEREINTFQYLEEANYLSKNYGYLYNRNASCEIIRRLLDSVKTTIAFPDKPQVTLMFTHSGN